ncbi:MAG: V-type ATP synthase subunit D [Candidatus Omnitrophica bacterium]|nr:V-type ATP synthase subunit D [Candidatus Omnitrophota bacterium]
MAKTRLTKNELKSKKEELKRFNRYLPMLMLKKRQLQAEILKVQQAIQNLSVEIGQLRNLVVNWVDVFAQDINISDLVSLKRINIDEGNVAGLDLPVYRNIEIEEKPYDVLFTPFWVDEGVKSLKKTIELKAQLLVFHRQLEVLKEELRITTQRVNLFEKIKIPQAKEAIRVIQIFLGELRTAEVVRGKIAKAKIQRKKEAVTLSS